MLTRREALCIAIAGMLAASLPTAAQTPATQAPLPVVASFSILADFVAEVGGPRVTVTALVGPNGDGHVYQPTPADARTVAAARLVVVNGLGFEGWMDRLVKASGSRAAVVTATRGVKPLRDPAAGHGHGHGHDIDPHAWQDVGNARLYVAAIRDALIEADPAGRTDYEARATAYLGRLDALDAEIRAAIARLPADRRRVITSHDAFGYFARAYGLAFVAPQGVSTESEASARDVARIIRQIRAEKLPAVFLENVSDPRLMERIAKETGARIGGRLYSDALSRPDGPAGTYIEMMRNNIRELSSALSS
jgi:zinc/manganese transport system substrate-binding protein